MLCVRPYNYLLLSQVLERVGLSHAEFLAAHRDQVVVYEVSCKALQAQTGGAAVPVSASENTGADSAQQQVELVRMCDVVRRLLGIECTAVKSVGSYSSD